MEDLAPRLRTRGGAVNRACALAEALWTAPADRDFAAFRKRLAVHRGRLLAAGVNAAGLDGMENEQDLIVYGGTP